MKHTVIEVVRSTNGVPFELRRARMQEIPEDPSAEVLRATRSQIAKGIKGDPTKPKKFTRVRYRTAQAGEVYGHRTAFARSTARVVVVGCQVFRGKDAIKLRKWALAK